MKKSLTLIFLLIAFVSLGQIKTWKPYTSKQGAFSAVFPGEPKLTPTANKSPEGFTVKGLMHMVSESGIVAYVIFNEMEAGINIMDDSTYLNSSVDLVLQKFNKEPEFIKDITFDGFPGKHFLVKFPDGLAEGKIILRTNRAYFLAAFFPEKQEKDREKFMNSFKFLPYQESTWKTYTSTDHFFKADFPAENPKVGEEETDDGELMYTYYGLDPQSGNNYSVAVEKYSPYAEYKNDSAVLAERTTWRYGDRIDSEKDITVAGRPAKELIVNFGKNHFKMKVVTFTNGNLGYSLFVFLPENEMTGKTATRFFNSFKFTGKVPGNLLEDKTALILKNLVSNDTTVWYEALSAFDQHDFKEKDLPAIESLITKTYADEADSVHNRKASLFEALAKIKSPASTAFIKKTFPTLTGNSLLEKEALEVLAYVNTRESNELLIELLKLHKPLKTKGWEYYYLFSGYRLDSLYKKEFLLKTLPFVSQPQYKSGIYGLAEGLLKEKTITYTDLQPYKQTIQTDLKNAADKYLKDSTYQILDDLINIVGYDQLAKKELDLINKLANSHNDFLRITAYSTLLRQGQKVNDKSLTKLAQDHYNRTEMFTSFETYDLLKNFPKQYLRQDSLAVSELFSYVSDEYFEPSSIQIVHREEREFKGQKKLFFVVKFQEPEDGGWYRGVCGPYDPNKLSVWEDVTGSNFDEWTEDQANLSEYLKEYLKSYEEE
jgi:hypothetical protein